MVHQRAINRDVLLVLDSRPYTRENHLKRFNADRKQEIVYEH